MRLDSSIGEGKKARALEEVYAIMRAAEALELAFVRGAAPRGAYEALIGDLQGKFDQALRLAVAAGATAGAREFIEAHDVRLPAAAQRLLVERVPATAVHTQGGDARAGAAVAYLVDLLPAFVTLIDTAATTRLVDTLVHQLNYVVPQLQQFTGLPPSWEGRLKLARWLTHLKGLNALDELTETETANLKMDAELAFNDFREAAKAQGLRQGAGGGGGGGAAEAGTGAGVAGVVATGVR